MDLVNDKLYYTSSGDIYKSNLDGSGSALFLDTTDVEDMELDIANNRLYYVQDSGVRKLARINLDGTGNTDVRTGLSDPEGLGLDLTNNIAYIVNEGSPAVNIQTTEIPTSTTLTTIVTGFTSGPEDVEVDVANSTIYYTAPGALYKNSTSGGSQTAVTTTNITGPNDLVLLDKVNFFWDDSTASGLWTTDNNWVEDVAPTTGAGTMTLSSSTVNTYSGATTVSAGTLVVADGSALGSNAAGTIVQSGGTLELATSEFVVDESLTLAGTGSSGQGALVGNSTTSRWNDSTITLAADSLISNTTGQMRIADDAISLGSNTLTFNATPGTDIVLANSTSISGTGGLIKNGGGVVRINATAANTYTGTTTVNAGILNLHNNDNVVAIAGDIIINGGTLKATGNYRTSATSDMTLNGGTFLLEESSQTLNTLTLTDNSTISFAGTDASSILNFSDSSGTTWTGGTQLSITNWRGSLTGGGNNQILFSSAGLTAGQLSQIKFINPLGFNPGTYDAIFIGNELVPTVPEPSTIIVGSLALLFIGYRERKRLLQLWKWLKALRASSE